MEFVPNTILCLTLLDMEDICLADFVAEYEVRKRDGRSYLPLMNNSGYLQKRIQTAVLRYYLHYEESLDLTRGLLILFLPFRNENTDIHNKDILLLFEENKDLVEHNRKKYESNINLVSLIKEIEKQQEERDNQEEENGGDEVEAQDFEKFDGETTSEKDIQNFIASMKSKAMKEIEKNSSSLFPSIETIREGIIKLNADQRTFFDDVCERIISCGEANQFIVFLAGEAGKISSLYRHFHM